MFLDPLYLLLTLPALALSLLAQWYVRSTFRRFSATPLSTNLRGVDVATQLLHSAGISRVTVAPFTGFLTDHYDPSTRTLRLSPAVYYGRSVSAAGVAAHEAGHAVQHFRRYGLMPVRQALVLPARLGSQLGLYAIIFGLLLHLLALAWLGLALFACIFLFELVTLPVELDASRRARALLLERGLASPADDYGISRVLRAAAFTYVAALLATALQLLYFITRVRAAEDER